MLINTRMTRIEDKIIYPDLSYKITGFCFKVHAELKRFGREIQYADSLERQLGESGIIFQREFNIPSIEEGGRSRNRVDFLIEDKIILDLKAKNHVTKDDYLQMMRYLISSDKKLGLIVNFRAAHLKPKRVLNPHYSRHSREDSH